jgi:hypothetical protein
MYGPPRQIAMLANKDISESSGLALSFRQPDLFWTHNDSGDTPRLFAFGRSGEHRGFCRLKDVEASDWEDMASFERDGKSWLLLADVGDNGRRRKTCQLYLCEEPSLTVSATVARRIEFRYENGSHNCESMAVDATQDIVLLTTKVYGPVCRVFQLTLPKQSTTEPFVAEQIAAISVPVTVAMDVSPDGLRAIVLTYGDAFEFSRKAGESWREAFGRPPQQITMPTRRQGETICYGRDGRSLYLTSERVPTPLWEVPWISTAKPGEALPGNDRPEK